MNKETFVLKDGTEITMEAGSSITSLMSAFGGKMEFITVWEKFTSENLKKCCTKAADGTIVGNYENLKMSNPEIDAYTNADGTVTATFHLEKKSEIEVRVDSIEDGQATQDGAIEDLGEAVSVLAKGGIV